MKTVKIMKLVINGQEITVVDGSNVDLTDTDRIIINTLDKKYEEVSKKQIDYIYDVLLHEVDDKDRSICEEVGLSPEHKNVPCIYIKLFETLIMKLIDIGHCEECLCDRVMYFSDTN